jgi:hypothetical protein
MICSSLNRLLRMGFPPVLPSRFTHIPWNKSRRGGQGYRGLRITVADWIEQVESNVA